MLGNVPFLCSPVLLHLSNTEEVISNYSFGFCLMLLLYLEILLFMRKRTHSLKGSESPNLFLSNILKRLQGGYGRWGSEDGGWACSLLTNCNACFEDKAWLCWLYTNKLVLWPALCLSCPRFCFFFNGLSPLPLLILKSLQVSSHLFLTAQWDSNSSWPIADTNHRLLPGY